MAKVETFWVNVTHNIVYLKSGYGAIWKTSASLQWPCTQRQCLCFYSLLRINMLLMKAQVGRTSKQDLCH